jgi:hypothetical protein
MLVSGPNWVAVDPLCSDLLASPPLQCFIYAQYQRAFGRKSFYKQSQQQRALLSARPGRATEHPMVAAEAPFFLQAHRSQGRSYGPLARREDSARQEHLDVLEDAFREQWREQDQNPYHLGR